ncbi:MAG: SusC/RagA family TonB-linked outer membrane protein, partial [Ferruginibacter sp.]
GRNALAGDLIYEDVNGDGIINDDDRTVIGNPYPKFAYGLSINLGWKGLDLALLFNGVSGVDIFNGVAPYAQSLWSDGNTTSDVFNASYLGTNGLTSQPRIGELAANGISFTPDANDNYRVANSYFVEKGSYLKLKNIQLGYNLPSKLLSRAAIKGLRIFVMANNVFTITKYSGIDPEIGSQNLGFNGNGGTTNRGIDSPYKYPSTRIYSFGLNLSF